MPPPSPTTDEALCALDPEDPPSPHVEGRDRCVSRAILGLATAVSGVGHCGGLVAAPADVPRVAAPARAGRAYVGGVQPAQRVTLVFVLLVSAPLCAYVWTGWVHAEHGLAAFVAAVLVVAAVGLLAGVHAVRRAG